MNSINPFRPNTLRQPLSSYVPADQANGSSSFGIMDADQANGSSSSRSEDSLEHPALTKTIATNQFEALFYGQFLDVNQGWKQDFALSNLISIQHGERALLRLIPGACLEYTRLVTESMFDVFNNGRDAKRKGEVFLNLIDSINRIKFDLDQQTQAKFESLNEREQKERAVIEFTSILMVLNDHRAFIGLDLSDIDLSELNLSGFDLRGSKFNLSGSEFRIVDLRNEELCRLIQT